VQERVATQHQTWGGKLSSPKIEKTSEKRIKKGEESQLKNDKGEVGTKDRPRKEDYRASLWLGKKFKNGYHGKGGGRHKRSPSPVANRWRQMRGLKLKRQLKKGKRMVKEEETGRTSNGQVQNIIPITGGAENFEEEKPRTNDPKFPH